MERWKIPAAIGVGSGLGAVAVVVSAKPAVTVGSPPPLWLPLPGASSGTWFMNEAENRVYYCRPDQGESTKIICHSLLVQGAGWQ